MGGGSSKQLAALTYDIPIFGAAAAGKSTVFKAIKITKQGGFTDEEKSMHASKVQVSLFQLARSLLEAAQKEGSSLGEDVAKDYLAATVTEDTNKIGENTLTSLQGFWAREDVLAAYELCAMKSNSSDYIVHNSARLLQKDAVSTDTDVLRFRLSTKFQDALSIHIESDNVYLRFTDLGGQRVHRKTWLEVGSDPNRNIKFMIYVIALDGFSKKMEEGDMNMMQEALLIFALLANKYFPEANFQIFLNKSDLLNPTLESHSFKAVFPAFEKDEKNPDDVLEFLKSQVINSLENNASGRVSFSTTNATDVTMMEKIVDKLSVEIIKGDVKQNF